MEPEDDSSRIDRCEGFRWHAVPIRAYREPGQGGDAGITRQELAPPAGAKQASFATRYFELGAGASTDLERHQHAHSVLVLRGRGHVLLDRTVYGIGPFDHIYVAAESLHQFHADFDEPLGFLCIVDRKRDRPRPASPEELAELLADPDLAPFVVGRGRSLRPDEL